MEKTIINPPELAKPVGFNHGVLTRGGSVLFLAGQDASGPDGAIVAPGDMVAQAEQVLSNLRAVVAAAGGSMQEIVKLNVYVTDRAAYKASMKPLGRLFRDYFGAYYPAMALFEVVSLFQDEGLIEMEGFAVIKEAP
jgi:enamine deaminase RidA (YjgF/YER057c/UK114 family)